MRVLGLDFETTGLDKTQERITEIGAVLWETDTGVPLQFMSCFVYDETMDARFTPPTLEMMERLCGITPAMLNEFGLAPRVAFSGLEELAAKAQYIVAHNGNQFDKPFLFEELKRWGMTESALYKTPWLDTKEDLPHGSPPDSNRLKHLALDKGFINPFPHRALTDVLTMLTVLSHWDIKDVIAYSQEPSVIVRALVPHPKQDQGAGKDAAKAAGFRWQEVDGKVFQLCWVKKIKVRQLAEEQAKLPGYQLVVIK